MTAEVTIESEPFKFSFSDRWSINKAAVGAWSPNQIVEIVSPNRNVGDSRELNVKIRCAREHLERSVFTEILNALHKGEIGDETSVAEWLRVNHDTKVNEIGYDAIEAKRINGKVIVKTKRTMVLPATKGEVGFTVEVLSLIHI